jgi:hypothetical protein
MPTELQTLDPEKQALEAEVKSLGLIPVVDAMSYEMAGERWKALVDTEKKVHQHFDPSCDAAHKAWKAMIALRDKFLKPLEENKAEQVRLMKTWQREEERKRQEAERQAQEEARKRAEDEAVARAAELEKAGFKESAQQAIAEPVAVPQVVAPSVVPKGFGGATQARWKAKVTDLKALVAAVAAGKAPLASIKADEVFLGQQARSLKAELRLPGVVVWEE